MKGYIALIIALIIEVLLLILILIALLVGVLGVFLPILPGLFFFGIATAIYSLMIKNNYGTITPHVHKRVLKNKDKITNLKIIQKYMPIIKKIQKKRAQKAKEEILKNGVILFGFNVALVLAFVFGFIGTSIVARMLNVHGLFLAYIPLAVIFVFASVSAIVWFRFGQILASRFKKKHVLNSSLVVLISILPLLVFLILFSGIITVVGIGSNELVVILFLGSLFMSVLAAVFELLLVNLGVITTLER